MYLRRKKTHEDSSEAPKSKGRRKQRRFRRKPKNDEETPQDTRDDSNLDTKSSDDLEKGSKAQKKVTYHYFGDLAKEVIEIEYEPGIPKPRSGSDVVIKVEASTVSHNDCILRRGVSPRFFDQVSLPATPGFDLVGRIVSCGDHVEYFAKGDRVAALVRIGGNARYAVVPASSLVRVPRSVGSAEAVSMVSTYMTAYQAFHKAVATFETKDMEEEHSIKKTLKGKNVLVTGGLGPVGRALIALCKNAGASNIVATAPESRHTYLRMVVGVKPLPPLPENWLPLVEGQMDVVFDGQCQDGFESPQRAISEEGVLVCVGMHALLNSEEMGLFGAPMSAIWAGTKASWFMSKTKSYEVWSSFCHDPEKFKDDLQHVFDMLRKRQIKPHIVKSVTLADVADAHLFIEKGKARGTIVCLPWKRGRHLRDQDEPSPQDEDEDRDE